MVRPFRRTRSAAPIVALLLLALIPAVAQGALGDRTLRKGMRGSDVRQLQSALTKLGFRTSADGQFGSGTQATVKRYERSKRAPADGVVTRAEGRTLKARAARPVTAQPADGFGARTLRPGSSGPDVRILQRLLGKLGFPTPITGTYGPITEENVREWEQSVNGTVDGIVSQGQAGEMRRRADARPGESTPAPAPPAGSGRYVFPIQGAHSYGTAINRYGASRSDHVHQGQDVFARAGTPLVAVHDGKVSVRRTAGGAGNYLVIQSDDGLDMVYMHMQSPGIVAPGQRVTAGQMVGRVGCTGGCSGDHLHFELWKGRWFAGGNSFDPLPLLRQWDATS